MMMQALEALRDALAAIPGVQTCRIGLEENITPDDYPLIRLVPSLAADGVTIGRRRMDLIIYFGMPLQPFDDTPDGSGRVRLEKLYAALLELEAQILDMIAQRGALYRETITDEDRLDTYKLMAIRCSVEA